jgi:hypothetical protein
VKREGAQNLMRDYARNETTYDCLGKTVWQRWHPDIPATSLDQDSGDHRAKHQCGGQMRPFEQANQGRRHHEQNAPLSRPSNV